jgi:hypothetical protein
VKRNRNAPTIYFVNAQLWLGKEIFGSAQADLTGIRRASIKMVLAPAFWLGLFVRP